MSIPERAQKARERYSERLRKRVEQLTYAKLPCMVSEREHDEILTEAIEDALLELMKACQRVALYSGLSEGKAVADLIEREIGRSTEDTVPSHVGDFPGTRGVKKHAT